MENHPTEKEKVESNHLTHKELRAKGRKKCWSHFQKVWLEVTLFLATPLVYTPITPNMITVTWIFIELFAGYLFMFGDYKINLVALFLFNIVAYLGDALDGVLARIRGSSSFLGVYLERLGVIFGTPFIFLGLAIGNYLRFNNFLFLIISLAGVTFWFLEKLVQLNSLWYKDQDLGTINDIYMESSIRTISKWKLILVEILRRGQPFNLLFFGVILDIPQQVSLIYSLFFFLEFLRKLSNNVRNLKKLDKNRNKTKSEEP